MGIEAKYEGLPCNCDCSEGDCQYCLHRTQIATLRAEGKREGGKDMLEWFILEGVRDEDSRGVAWRCIREDKIDARLADLEKEQGDDEV